MGKTHNTALLPLAYPEMQCVIGRWGHTRGPGSQVSRYLEKSCVGNRAGVGVGGVWGMPGS